MITVEDKNLQKYIMFKLNKIDSNFTQEELLTLKELVIEDTVYIFYFSYFTNLEKIELINIEVSNELLLALKNLPFLTTIIFDHCQIQDEKELINLKIPSLSFISCHLKDISFLKEMTFLTELTLTNQQEITFEIINQLIQLQYLQLSFSTIIDKSRLCLPRIEKLYIDNVKISEFSLFNVLSLQKLTLLSISRLQYTNNKSIIQQLIHAGITVKIENMVDLRTLGDDYE